MEKLTIFSNFFLENFTDPLNAIFASYVYLKVVG